MLPAIIDSLMPKPPAAAAAAVTPKPRASRLVGPPMLLQPAACDSNPRTPKHARAQTGEVAATILDLLSQPQQEQPLSSTRESEWDDASMGSRRGSAAEVEGTAHQTDQEHAVVPAADQTPEATEHAATLDFLQVPVVANAYRNVVLPLKCAKYPCACYCMQMSVPDAVSCSLSMVVHKTPLATPVS